MYLRSRASVCSLVCGLLLSVSYKMSCPFLQDDQVVLQCTASILKEQIKLCLSCEGFGNRLAFLEATSNAQVEQRQHRIVILLITDAWAACLAEQLIMFCLAECASRLGNLLLYLGTIFVSACPAGNAGQHHRDE